ESISIGRGPGTPGRVDLADDNLIDSRRRWSRSGRRCGRRCRRWCGRRTRRAATGPIQLEAPLLAAPSINRDLVAGARGGIEGYRTGPDHAVLNIVVEDQSGQAPNGTSSVNGDNRVEITAGGGDRGRTGRWRRPLGPDCVAGTEGGRIRRVMAGLAAFAGGAEVCSRYAPRTTADRLGVGKIIVRRRGRRRGRRWWRIVVRQVVPKRRECQRVATGDCPAAAGG